MKDLSSEDTLFAVLPILLVLLALGAGIFVYSSFTGDTRSRAAFPNTISPTPIPPVRITPTKSILPVKGRTACSQLYSPVCGIDGITYANSCEAGLVGVAIAQTGECVTPKPTRTITPIPPIRIP